MANTNPIIEVKKVNFTYNKGKDNEYQALADINLDIYPEEFIAILGPSGCGKSSLLNILAGLEKPDEGMINVMGRDLMAMNGREFADYHRLEVGMIYQAYNLITSLSVLDNVALPQIFINTHRGKRNALAKTLLERFGILEQAHRIPTELSGGQQQRIGIARSIVNDPSLILADEPVGNLDSTSAENVLNILSDLNTKEKKTIIMVTHNPENVIYADRIIHMKDGVIIREEINENKGKPLAKKEDGKTAKSPTEEMASMLRTYSGLSNEQINILIMPYKSKMFVNYFTSEKNYEETKVFEDAIQRQLMGTITRAEFLDILHRPSRDGGIGFDIRSSEKIIRRMDRIIRLAYFMQQKFHQVKNERGGHEKVVIEEKTQKLTDYLLKTCYNKHYQNLDEAQLSRLKSAVKDRFENNMQKSEFYNYLDKSFKEDGVGLNSKTARAITDEMELVLVVGFGVSQNESMRKLKLEKAESASMVSNSAMDLESSRVMNSIAERLKKINNK
ncbi:ABC transporter ATP-binding protein [Candidatus Parcubacteria bacterium]|nr:ABC transporter ATP-binding protein [Patescibacteria group bacterium]MBU4309516.1 ABC transporter ATP-binding protein [Patescibacteria group bacterium]MBU4432052.1 ABC transporter ATP-binding protein [Patescibacteria group bacterium]MBU4577222.1 ABC transporter ATP-binding protein [Patescibacteria group bacterium]MCG2696868.1 ABC transporter ATP-binding protein [Candidatus Parcubacteria bacterium]